MTDTSYTHIAILADRTGSMGGFADPSGLTRKSELTTAGIKDLIREQAAQPGRTTFSLVQFDSQGTDQIATFAQGDHPDIAEWRIVPRGMTPLLDATGMLITQTGEYLAALSENERPGRVYFVVGTDGEENCSQEYTKKRLAAMIKTQREDYGWEFVFIGADIDAFSEAGSMGIPTGSTLTTNSANLGVAYAGTASAITRSRAGGQSVSYTDEERDKAAGK